MIRIVGVDPGYRNLAWARIDIDTKENKIVAVDCRHVDVGSCSEPIDIIYKVWSYLNHVEPFKNAQFVEIENQDFGRKNSTPANVGLSWLIASQAWTQNPWASVEFSQSKSKFKAFGYAVPYKRGTPKHERKKFIKNTSIRMATHVLVQCGFDPASVFKNGEQSKWEHLADALGLALTRYRLLLPLPKD